MPAPRTFSAATLVLLVIPSPLRMASPFVRSTKENHHHVPTPRPHRRARRCSLPGCRARLHEQRHLRECQTAAISGDYTAAELSTALRGVPNDLDEYTECRDVIRRSQLSDVGPGLSSGAGGTTGVTRGGKTPPAASGGTAKEMATATPAGMKAASDAGQRPSETVEVGGEQLSPERAGYSPVGAGNVVPTPIVVAVLLLGLGLARRRHLHP